MILAINFLIRALATSSHSPKTVGAADPLRPRGERYACTSRLIAETAVGSARVSARWFSATDEERARAAEELLDCLSPPSGESISLRHPDTNAVLATVNSLTPRISTPTRVRGTATPTLVLTSSDPDVVKRDLHLKFDWSKAGFGNIMLLSGSIRNDGTHHATAKDIEITCTHYAPSGTVIDSNVEVLYQQVAPFKTIRFKELNMGFIHTQASKTSCTITSVVIH